MTEVAKIDQPRLPAAASPVDLIRTAVEKGMDAAQLATLMDLQERWEKGEAKKAFIAAMGAFKENPPELVKNKEVSYGKGKETAYSHATLDQVSGVIGKALTEHDITHRWSVEQSETSIKVTCILTHAQGHSEETTLAAPADNSGSKNSIQAIGSTVTYLQRYTLLAAVGLAVKDQDKDGAVPLELITSAQKDQIIKLMRETNTVTAQFLKYLKVDSLDQLPAVKFQSAIAALNDKKARQ